MGSQGELRLQPSGVGNLRRAVQRFVTQHSPAAAATASTQSPTAQRVYACRRLVAPLLLLRAPTGEPLGHGVWVSELAPLDWPLMAVRGVELGEGAFRCLTDTLPGMQVGCWWGAVRRDAELGQPLA